MAKKKNYGDVGPPYNEAAEVEAEESHQEAPEPRTGDQIVYTGVIYRKDGAHIDAAGYTREDANVQGCVPYDVVPVVVNIEEALLTALCKLDALDKLVLGLP